MDARITGNAPPTVEDLLPEIVGRLRDALAPLSIYLFGSYAYGMPGPDSDLDLLVVIRNAAPHSESDAYRALTGIPIPVDVLVYTQEQFENRSNWPVGLERTIAERGRLLYAA